MSMSPEQKAFEQAVLDNPDDDITRLVYADWLEEQGEVERAEFIRAQMALHQGIETDSEGKTTPLSYARKVELKQRCDELLLNSGDAWVPGKLKEMEEKGIIDGYEFRRGFVEHIEIKANKFTTNIVEELPKIITVRGMRMSWIHAGNVSEIFDKDNAEFFRRLTAFSPRLMSDDEAINNQVINQVLKYLKTQEVQLQNCDLTRQTVTNTELEYLKDMPLKSLNLESTFISNGGLEYLKNMPLQSLNLSTIGFYNEENFEYGITDEGLEHLKDTKTLQYLNLSHSGITDKGLKYLKDTKTLEHLDISLTLIVGHGLKYLKDIPLQYLAIAAPWSIYPEVINNTLKYLKKMPLRHLHMSTAQINNDGLQHIRDIVTLRSLDLFGNMDIDDNGLVYLQKMQELQYLELGNTWITNEGLKHIPHLPLLSLKLPSSQGITTENFLEHLVHGGFQDIENVVIGNEAIPKYHLEAARQQYTEQQEGIESEPAKGKEKQETWVSKSGKTGKGKKKGG